MSEVADTPAQSGEARTTNTAEAGATVGIQAESVHNSNVYFVQPDAPPQRKYEVGVNFLEGGVPGEARRLIGEALANGHDTYEVRFHLALAILSKRSDRDLTDEDRDQIAQMSGPPPDAKSDEWARALAVIQTLLDYMDAPPADPAPVLRQLHALRPEQRAKILTHLDQMLNGVLKDHLWEEARGAAERDQLDNDRAHRAWAYFEPHPAPPRVRVPHDGPPTPSEWVSAAVAAAIFLAAFAGLAFGVITNWSSWPVLCLLLVVAAGLTGAYAGSVWLYRRARLEALKRVHADAHEPEQGFAKRVHGRFEYYAHKYAPEQDRDRWIDETAGLRSNLRDEIVDLYPDVQRIREIDWIVRFLVRRVLKEWQNGTLHDYLARYHTPITIKILFLASTLVVVPAGVVVVDSAVRADPLLAILATPLALASGYIAGVRAQKLASRWHRFIEGEEERRAELAARTAEYGRWIKRFTSIQPSEEEMERWLDCDRKIFIDEALKAYRLAWRDVISHAVLHGPGDYYRRARESNGQWRYSKYNLRLLLVTRHGVREVAARLNFFKAALDIHERRNFRFDAVSSVGVEINRNPDRFILELTLANGPSRSLGIVDATPESIKESGEADISKDRDLDASGFAHTLHVLEGIAAEGRSWINRRRLVLVR